MQDINAIVRYESLVSYRNLIDREIKNVSLALSKLPVGTVSVQANGKYQQFRLTTSNETTKKLIRKKGFKIVSEYQRKDSQKTVVCYIPKQNSDFARAFIDRELLENNQRILEQISKWMDSYIDKIEVLITRNNFSKSKLKIVNKDQIEREKWFYEWMNTPYHRNEVYDNPNHMTKAGYIVKSKSEKDIANKLYENKIPFLYEPYMLANGFDHYPDFVILHPKTMKVYIWEHNGQMDSKIYVNKVAYRFRDYSNEGFILGDDLIFTSETKTRPLKMEDVDDIIYRILLDRGDRKNTSFNFEYWNDMIHRI